MRMFNKEIKVKRKEDIRYGKTEKAPEDTLSDIMKLLRKHGCEKVGSMYLGDEVRIGFTLDNLPFLIDIPKVYVNNRYQPKIGIRIVFRYLETILELTKSRAVSVHSLFLPMAQVRDPEDDTLKPFADVWIKNISEGKYKPEKLLLGE
jgi:hypothetical protein